MKIHFDQSKKKVDLDFSKFDRFINILIVIIICGTVIWCIAKPDLSNFKIVLPEKTQDDTVYTEGSSIDWDEYRKFVTMDKKYIRYLAKHKSMVTGYIVIIPKEKGNNGYYNIVITPSDTDTSIGILCCFDKHYFPKDMSPGIHTFNCNLDRDLENNSLYCINPILVA